MPFWYVIRYGLMGRVGRFSSEASDYQRGQTVVIRSHRGTELGEVLVSVPAPSPTDPTSASSASAQILRPADEEDFERARLADADRSERFETCRRVFEDGTWPLELVDVEPLLDDRRTVLHYLGPHRLDVAGLLAAFRSTCKLDVMLEPVGRDAPEPEDEMAEAPEAEHGCGQGGCGSGGGCGSTHGGCGSCSVKKLVASRKAVIPG